MSPILCAGVTTYKGIKETEAKPGEWITISGIGGLGHVAVQYAKAMGLHVVALDVFNAHSQGEERRYQYDLERPRLWRLMPHGASTPLFAALATFLLVLPELEKRDDHNKTAQPEMPKTELTGVPQDQRRSRNPRTANQIDNFLPARQGNDFELRHKKDYKTGDDRTHCRQATIPAIGG